MQHQTGSLSEKLKEKERAEEDVYFGKRDRVLLEELRLKTETQQQGTRTLAGMRCPDCGTVLERVTHHGVTIEQCPEGHGLWLTEAELHALAKRERDSTKRERDSWIARYLYRPRLT